MGRHEVPGGRPAGARLLFGLLALGVALGLPSGAHGLTSLEAEAKALRKQVKDREAPVQSLHEFLSSIEIRVAAGEEDALRAAYWIHRALADELGWPERIESSRREFALSEHMSPLSRAASADRHGVKLLANQEWASAREFFLLAVSLLPSDHFRLAEIHQSIAEAARNERDFESANRHLDIAEPLIERDQSPDKCRLKQHAKRGQIAIDQGLPDLALAEWVKEREILDRIEPKDGPPSVEFLDALIRKANILLALERFESLEAEIAAALARLGDERSPERAALELRLGIALARLEARDPERLGRAEAAFRRVLEQNATPADRLAALLRLSLLYLAEDRIDDAKESLARVHESFAPTAGLPLLDRAMLVSVETEVRLRETRDLPPANRARELASRHAAAEATFDEMIADWRSQPLSPSGSGFLRSGRARRLISSLVRIALARDPGQGGLERALAYVTRSQQAGTVARELDSPLPDLAAVRREIIAEGEGLLIYLPTPEAWHLFAIDRDTLRHVDLPPRHVIEEARTNLLAIALLPPANLSSEELRPRARDLDEAGRRLFQLVVPEALREPLKKWRGIAVVGLDLMGYVPFECLVTPEGALLGLEKTVRYLPSLPVGSTLAERRSRRLAPSLGGVLLADARPRADASTSDASLPPLPLSREEAGAMVHRRGENRLWELLLGGDASLERLSVAPLDRAAVVQILAHGVDDPAVGPKPRIALTPDADGSNEFVDADDLASLPLPAVVLLTVCGAGRGPQRWGDPGASDLGGSAFRSPRVESVILPYARLEYSAAVALSTVFHEEIARGRGPGEAMRLARRTLVEGGGRHADPFYHSLLHVHGLGDFSPLPASMLDAPATPSRSLLVSIAAGLALCLALFGWWRKSRLADAGHPPPVGSGSSS